MPQPVMDQLEAVAKYMREAEGNGPAPDGCYFCGGNHTTDACDQPEQEEFYESIR